LTDEGGIIFTCTPL